MPKRKISRHHKIISAISHLTPKFSHVILGTRRMFQKIAAVSLWFVITPFLLILLTLLTTQKSHIEALSKIIPTVSTPNYKSDENVTEGYVLGVEISDLRPILVANFLKGTKLEPYADYIVQISDKYGIDYRLIPAIAMKESGAGNAINESTHNAWGFENGRTSWSSWEEAIDKVAKTLKVRYLDRGMTTPEEMMPVYAPPQVTTGGKWAKDINRFFLELESL